MKAIIQEIEEVIREKLSEELQKLFRFLHNIVGRVKVV